MGLFSRVKWLEERFEDEHKKVLKLEDELYDLKQETYAHKIEKKLEEYSEKYGRKITIERRKCLYSSRDNLCIDGNPIVELAHFYKEKYEETCSAENDIKAWLFDEKTKEEKSNEQKRKKKSS